MKKAYPHLPNEEVANLIQSWNTATAAHRAHVERRPRTGKPCPTCKGTGDYPENFDCLRCAGRGVDPRW